MPQHAIKKGNPRPFARLSGGTAVLNPGADVLPSAASAFLPAKVKPNPLFLPTVSVAGKGLDAPNARYEDKRGESGCRLMASLVN